jgi:RHS repeat-associated protein
VVYVHAGQQVIADYARGAAAAAPSFRYVYGSYVDEPLLRHAGTGTTLPTSGTAALYYHRNQQYSIVGLSDAAGALVERYAYTAYGELTILAPDRTLRATSSFHNRYTYTGREWDPTLRLYYFRARWLEPKAGRFIGRDPLGYVDGMGLYGAYWTLRGTDPSGNMIIDIDSWIPDLGLAVLGRDWSSKPGYHLEGYWVGPVDNVSENSMCCAELKDYWEVSGFRHPLFCINKCLAEYGATTTGWLSYGLGFPALWYGLGPYASPTPSVLFKWPTAALVGVIGLGGYSASLSASGCSTKCYTDVCVAFFAQPQKRRHHYGFFRSCLNGGEFGYHYWACPPPANAFNINP